MAVLSSSFFVVTQWPLLRLSARRALPGVLEWVTGYVILLFFSVLANSFISTREFYFIVVFVVVVLSPIPLGSGGVRGHLAGAQPPAG